MTDVAAAGLRSRAVRTVLGSLTTFVLASALAVTVAWAGDSWLGLPTGPSLPREVWTTIVSAGPADDWVCDVALLPDDGVVAAGYGGFGRTQAPAYRGLAIAWDAAGRERWRTSLDRTPDPAEPTGPAGGGFWSVAAGEDGVALGGLVTGSFPPFVEAALFRSLGLDGRQRWQRIWHDGAWTNARGVALGPGGDVWAAGSAFHAWDGRTEHQWAVWRYAADGTLAPGHPWTYDLGGRVYLPDFAWDLALDRAGNVTVVGSVGVAGDSAESLTNDTDWCVRSYAPTGELRWTEQLDGGKRLLDRALRVALDGADDVLVTGFVNVGEDNGAGGRWSVHVVKYAGGSRVGGKRLRWTRSFPAPAPAGHVWPAVATDSAGDVWLAAGVMDERGVRHRRLERLDGATGAVKLTYDWPSTRDEGWSAAAWHNGYLAMGGRVEAPGGTDWVITLLAPGKR